MDLHCLSRSVEQYNKLEDKRYDFVDCLLDLREMRTRSPSDEHRDPQLAVFYYFLKSLYDTGKAAKYHAKMEASTKIDHRKSFSKGNYILTGDVLLDYYGVNNTEDHGKDTARVYRGTLLLLAGQVVIEYSGERDHRQKLKDYDKIKDDQYMIVDSVAGKIIVYTFCDYQVETRIFEVNDVVNVRFLRYIKINANKILSPGIVQKIL